MAVQRLKKIAEALQKQKAKVRKLFLKKMESLDPELNALLTPLLLPTIEQISHDSFIAGSGFEQEFDLMLEKKIPSRKRKP